HSFAPGFVDRASPTLLAYRPEDGPVIELKELDHFGIDVSDLDRARRFYFDVLWGRVIRPMGAAVKTHRLPLPFGTRNFALHLNPSSRRDGKTVLKDPRGKAHVAFKVSPADFETALANFERADIPFNGPVDWGDHLCLYFLDPDGNLLELVNQWRPG